MRVHIIAVGQSRGTAENALIEDYLGRARALGKRVGFTSIAVEEIAVSRLRESRARIAEEGERLTSRIPSGSHVVLLDSRGKGLTSEAFAEMLGAMSDAGARDIAFVIGGPDGLDLGPGVKAGRSIAMGSQTWPHLLVRVMLAEQVYRAVTILTHHPYHRP